MCQHHALHVPCGARGVGNHYHVGLSHSHRISESLAIFPSLPTWSPFYLLPSRCHHLRMASPSLGVNTSNHGRIFGHGCAWHHLRWRQHLRHRTSIITFVGIWFSPLFLFPPLLFCLNLDLNHIFFQIWWLLGFIVVVQWISVYYSFLEQLFSLMLNCSLWQHHLLMV